MEPTMRRNAIIAIQDLETRLGLDRMSSDSPTSRLERQPVTMTGSDAADCLAVKKLLIPRALCVLCGCFPELIQRNRGGRGGRWGSLYRQPL